MAQFAGVGAEVLGDALRVKELPTQVLYQAFEEAGTDLAQVRAFVVCMCVCCVCVCVCVFVQCVCCVVCF